MEKTIVISTCRFRCQCQYRYVNTEISKWPFPWILSVSYGKEEVSSGDGKLVWFSTLFNAYQAFRRDFQLQQDRLYLAFTCSKATIKTLEQDMKHVWSWNLTINTPKQHFQTVFCCLCCYLWTHFILSYSVYSSSVLVFCWLWAPNSIILTIPIQLTINISKNLRRTRLFLQ